MRSTSTIMLGFCVIMLHFFDDLNAQYRIRTSVLAGGGNGSSTASFRLFSTLGQELIGTPESGNYGMLSGFWLAPQLPTSVEKTQEPMPAEYRLDQNFPNPFNPATAIRFALKEKTHVTLIVYNLLGQVIETLVNQELSAGEYRANFSGAGRASGFYVYRITAGDFVAVRRLLLLK